ncbi:hypothetical protein G3I18_22555, partial [Actinospica acidiphila]|nr:hypothetical protein [Actinospica acidiphila]
SAAEVVAAVFDRAAQRDPGRRRPWVVLADGDRRRSDSVRAETRHRTS